MASRPRLTLAVRRAHRIAPGATIRVRPILSALDTKSLSSAHDPPTVENDSLSGHEVGAARCEIADKLGDVLVSAHGAQRCFTNNCGKLFIRIELSNDRAIDKSERDCIHRDVWREFERHALRQHVEPGFRS